MRAGRMLSTGAGALLVALVGILLEAPAAAQEVNVPLACDVQPPGQVAGSDRIAQQVDGPSGLVALTFDGGADRGYVDDILDTLKEMGVPATFSVTGAWAQSSPDAVQRMAADGHQVINHTLDHRSFTGCSDRLGGLSPFARRDELVQADAILAPLLGYSTCPWFRLPYGDDDERVLVDVAPAGFTLKLGWTIDTLGWRGVSAERIVARSLRLAAPGAIYVMHVGAGSQDGPALPAVIAGLREQGYGFATAAALSLEAP